jgi:hypothetical protein
VFASRLIGVTGMIERSGGFAEVREMLSPSLNVRENRALASEIKFIVTAAQADGIAGWARTRMGPDPNAIGEGGDVYRITSLYFDTDRFDVFHRHGSFGRAKYRIRRYDSAKSAFLERKLKTRDLVCKRRTKVKIRELDRLSNGGRDLSWDGDWFHRRLAARELRPVCQVTYLRAARVSMTESGPIRLTLDRAIRTAAIEGPRFREIECGIPLKGEPLILELKFRAPLPEQFRLLVEEFGLVSAPVSKYRTAAATLGLVAPRLD